MTLSPFLPDGRQWAWNSSTLEPAKECARKYYYKVKLGLVPKAWSVHITFGKHYAKALESYHDLRAQGFSYHAALHTVVSCVLFDTWEHENDGEGNIILGAGHPWQSDHPSKNRETLIRSIVWYLDQFENDPCETIRLGDGRPAVELAFSFQVEENIWFTGHIDRLVTYAGECYVQDQKTTGSTLSSHYFQRYTPDNQMSLYSLASTVVWQTPVRGVMIDAAQIAVGFTRFERGFAFRTPSQLSEWLSDAKYFIRRTWAAEADGWPMNDTACSKYGGCEFLGICSKAPQVREEFLKTGFVKAFRSPLEI